MFISKPSEIRGVIDDYFTGLTAARNMSLALFCRLRSYAPSQKLHAALWKARARAQATHPHRKKVVRLLVAYCVETCDIRALETMF